MAAKAFNGWVEGDVAIEIIGKMIAEESRRLDDLLDAYDLHEMDEDDKDVQSDPKYKSSIAKLDMYHKEIDSIHSGTNLDLIFNKVHLEYAPYIRDRHTSLVNH